MNGRPLSELGKGDFHLKWIWVALIIAVTIYVYSPAMNRLFVSDQLRYLAELRSTQSSNLMIAGLHHLDYSNSRQYWKGDEITFRPLLFVWLAIQAGLFSYHFIAWNITHLCLHLLVVLLLFRFLLQMQSVFFAGLFSLLFSVMTPLLELPVWNHLGGYLISFALMILALSALYPMLTHEREFTQRQLGPYLLFITLACFFYEMIAPFSWLIGIWLWISLGKKDQTFSKLWPMALPSLIYAAAYIIHLQHLPQSWHAHSGLGNDLARIGNPPNWPVRSFIALYHWTFQVLFPVRLALEIDCYERLKVSLGHTPFTFLAWLNCFVTIVLSVTGFFGISTARLVQRFSFLGLLVSIILAYIGFINFARNTDNVGYYLYLFCVFGTILVAGMMDWSQAVCRYKKYVFAGALVAFTTLHAYLTHGICQAIAQVNQKDSARFSLINAVVDQHKREPDFSFNVRNSPLNTLRLTLRKGYLDDPNAIEIEIPDLKFLYGEYFQENNAKYTIDLKEYE